MENNNPVHLIGMTEAEGNACLDEHGFLEVCTWTDCTKDPVVQLMFKKPGAGFSQEVKSAAACEDHKSSLEDMIQKVTGLGGPS